MDLSELGGLLQFCNKKDVEKQMYPLWLVHFLLSGINKTEPMAFKQMLDGVLEGAKPQRTGDEILAEFLPLAE